MMQDDPGSIQAISNCIFLAWALRQKTKSYSEISCPVLIWRSFTEAKISFQWFVLVSQLKEYDTTRKLTIGKRYQATLDFSLLGEELFVWKLNLNKERASPIEGL